MVTRSPVNICSPRGRAQPGGWIAGSRINSLSPISAHASGHSAYQRWLSLLRPRLALRERERDTEVERGRHSMPYSCRQPEVFSLLIGGKICRSSLLVRKCVARLWLAWYGVTCLLLGGNLLNLVAPLLLIEKIRLSSLVGKKIGTGIPRNLSLIAEKL